jgi:peroxiredoxin
MQKYIISTIVILVLIGGGFLLFAGNNNDSSNNSASTGSEVGDIAPDFAITTLAGKTIRNTDLRGKVVVITSSAAWCQTCIMEAQQFSPVYKKYKDQPVVFITVDIDPRDSVEFIQQFKKDNDTPWAYTNAQGGAELSKNYELKRFEITYVIDQEGIIHFKDGVITSSEKLNAILNQLL